MLRMAGEKVPCGTTNPFAFTAINRFPRRPLPAARASFDFDKRQHRTVISNQVDFASRAAVVSLNESVAVGFYQVLDRQRFPAPPSVRCLLRTPHERNVSPFAAGAKRGGVPGPERTVVN